ncbi:unnamed protein product [Knipowitschia caucasica]
MGDGEVMEMAALGRPFNLGMLYDCRADRLVPGITLWDIGDLMQDTRVAPKPNSEFHVVASESISDKSSSMGVEASVKASFLGGLIEVEGSAKYLKETKTSKNQARVTLQYKTTTEFKELTMNHLGRGNIKHSYIFDKGIATHVVTAILYGAQAFFVFDREISKEENHDHVQGSLRVKVTSIPLLAIEGSGALDLDEQARESVNKFSCTFYGDFCLDQSPTTFEDAIKVYRDLPKLLGNDGEKAVPVKVWLVPLSTLDSSAAKLVREISVRLVLEAQTILEDLSDIEMRCNDVLKSTAAQQFPLIAKKIQTFLALCSEFKLGFQGTLAKKLPKIRGGGAEEAELAEFLKERAASPFNNNSLDQWMDGREKEAYTLKSITNLLANAKILQSEDHLYQETFNSHKTVCFLFSSLGDTDPYLCAVESYLRGEQSDEFGPGAQDIEKEQWYCSREMCDAVRCNAKLFSDFVENNKDEDTGFFVVGLQDENYKGSTIYIYEDGFRVLDNFQPPSKPLSVNVDNIEHNSVTLSFSAPSFGVETIKTYRVEYCVDGAEEWEQTETEGDQVTVTGLSPNTEYSFRVRAVTDVGVGPAAQVDNIVKTLPCGPPEELQVTVNFSEVLVHWKRPAEVGQNVQIHSYSVEHGETENEIQWKQEASYSEQVLIFGLDPLAPYTIRVWCECGDDGKSKEITTVTRSRPTETLIQSCEKVSDDDNIPTIYKLPLTEEELELSGCTRYVYGEETQMENRSIILVGSEGGDKTTLIDALINYILGVKWTDSYRFKLTEEDQNSDVAIYKINHQDGFRINSSLTIIDAPGFGDAHDISTNREIIEQLYKLFTDNGVDCLHAVCFVMQSASEKPSHLRYLVDSFLSVLGNDMGENLTFLLTFANNEPSPALLALADLGLPSPEVVDGVPAHYKFNNSVLFTSNQDSEANSEEKLIWEIGMENIKSFLNNLHQTESKSLDLTREVMRERKQLEDLVEDLEEQMNVGVALRSQILDAEEETSEEMREEYENRREEVVELGKDLETRIVHLASIALKPSPLQSSEYIDSLVVETASEAKPQWEKYVQTLQEMKILAEIMEKVGIGENLLESMPANDENDE